MTEVRTTSSTGGEKGTKPERYDLIPVDALASVARLYGEGAKKYSEHNWRKGYEWSKSYAALQRHSNEFWKGVDIDPETGEPHLAAVIFHSLALITFMKEQPEFDDRYKKLTEQQRESLVVDIRSRLPHIDLDPVTQTRPCDRCGYVSEDYKHFTFVKHTHEFVCEDASACARRQRQRL